MIDSAASTQGDHLELLLRAYVESNADQRVRTSKGDGPDPGPCDWTVVFDTETKVDAAQRLRVGTFIVHDGDRVTSRGLFYEQRNLKPRDMLVLESFARKRGLTLMPVVDFVER